MARPYDLRARGATPPDRLPPRCRIGAPPGKGRGKGRPYGHRRPTTPTTKGSTVAISETMPSITHVAVTVTDLDASEAWYTKVLGVAPVLHEDTGPFRHIVYLVGTTLLGLHGFPVLTSTAPFDERRPGLDHIAFGVASRQELVEWAARLDALGVPHGDIVDAGYGSGLAFRDPDNIALELFAPPA
jgi:catechol 2,3-dioxygenase-like lactoylglutathione lyase family enzyme